MQDPTRDGELLSATDAHAALVETLDERVRDEVRREGLGQQRDPPLVRRVAEGVVRAHDQRSLTGSVAPVADVDSVVGGLMARVSGFGPWQAFLDDPEVEGLVHIHDLCKRRYRGRRPLES